MNDNPLIQNLNSIHTTTMGVARIKRNLSLGDCDVVDWCKNQVLQSKEIIRKGKNWYITTNNAIITINAGSYTIITAHPTKLKEQ